MKLMGKKDAPTLPHRLWEILYEVEARKRKNKIGIKKLSLSCQKYNQQTCQKCVFFKIYTILYILLYKDFQEKILFNLNVYILTNIYKIEYIILDWEKNK